MSTIPRRKPRGGRGRKAPKSYRKRRVEPPRGVREKVCTNRATKARQLVAPGDFALSPVTRDPLAYLQAAFDYEDAIEEELATQSPDPLAYLQAAFDYEDAIEEEMARNRPRVVMPPPHRLNEVEGRRYRTLVLQMVRASAPALPGDLLGILTQFLGNHVPNEGAVAPLPTPPRRPQIQYYVPETDVVRRRRDRRRAGPGDAHDYRDVPRDDWSGDDY